MKIYIIILAFVVLAFTACQETNSILQPENTSSSDILSKYDNLDTVSSNKLDRSLRNNFTTSYSSHFIGGSEIVELESFKEKFTKNYTVNGETGGVLFLKISWRNEDSIKVFLDSKLTIPRGAFEGELTFDMIFDLDNYALELYPSPYTFDLPVLLDLKFTNIDLSNIDIDNIDFTYLDGSENMEYKKASFDLDKGDIEVKGAKLHHFSRYGWTRRR